VPGSGIDPTLADAYHAECVNQMIPQLHDEAGVQDEALLASTVLLRMYEIMKGMGEKDHQYHLWGASSLVSIQKINVNTRNLRHTAFWAFLRQDVTIALATNQPTKLDLESCGVELEFTEVDDDIWTNRMTFLLAKTVNFCFGPIQKTMEGWTALKGEVDLWKERAPASFKPFYTQPHGVHGEPFPAIWLLFPWHSMSPLDVLILVCAVQSYNLAQICLALYSPGIPPGIAALQFLRRMEVQVESYAREICGISLTNANVSARINAVEPLRLCTTSDGTSDNLGGRCLPASAQRESVVNLLRSIQNEHSWPCDSVIASWNGFGFLFDS
jgi:hypothetical protein